MRLSFVRLSLAASVAFAALVPRVAHGQAAQDNSAAVEALFSEGKRLASEGKYAEACPKFRASYALEQRIGTLLNLADCYEKNNQLASAWARFVEVRTLAGRAGQAEREQYATEHAAALEPKLSKLTIVVKAPAPGTVIKRDGVVVDPAVYGTAVAVDSGSHTIDAEAPGKRPFSTMVQVNDGADQRTTEVPALVDAPHAENAGDGTVAPRPGAEATPKSSRGTIGIVVAGVGLVSIGVGSYFGVAALGKKDDSKTYCNLNQVKNDCSQTGVDLRSDALTDATVSTVLIGVGVAAVGAGAVLYFTAPSSRVKANVAFDGRTIRLGGTF
jgi:hypothetical protein